METRSYRSEARFYGLVLAALLLLTAATVAAAGIHFGNEVFNVGIALGIATLKAFLVALFFMHLRHDKPMNALIFLTGFAILAIFLALTLMDVDTRLPVTPSVVSSQGNPA